MPFSTCNRGCMTFRYMRSMDSTVRMTCLCRTSATVVDIFIVQAPIGTVSRPTPLVGSQMAFHRHYARSEPVCPIRATLCELTCFPTASHVSLNSLGETERSAAEE